MKNPVILLIGALAFCLTRVNATTTLQDGLVGFYLFDGDTKDSASTSNDLNVYGATSSEGRRSTSNPGDGSYSFNGTSYLSSANNVGISGNSGRTFSLWIKVSTGQNFGNTSGGQLLGFGSTGITPSGGTHTTGTLFSLSYIGPNNASMANHDINFQMNGSFIGKNFLERPLFGLDQWQHVVLTYDGSVGASELYLNGKLTLNSELFGSSNPLAGLNTTDSALFLGAGFGSSETWLNGFQGMIDDVRIYNRALTGSEVSNLYALELPEPSASSLFVIGLGGLISLRRRKQA